MDTELVFSNNLIGGLFCIVIACLMMPVFYLIFYTMKKKINLLTTALGIVGFLVFGYLISGFLLGSLAPTDRAAEAPARYALIRSVCVAVAEGGGALAAMLLLRRRFDDISTPISYALGYPLINMLVIGGANSFYRMAEAYTVNSKGLDAVLESVEGDAVERLREQLTELSQSPAYEYYFSAVDYICIFVIFVAICRIMWYAVHESGKSRIVLAALGLVFRFGAELPVALYQCGATRNYIACEIVRYAVTALCVGLAVLLALRYDGREKVSAGPLNRRLL